MSDNINAFPVQRIEATITQNIAPNADVVGAFNVADEALLYADQKIYQYGQFGPYNQTLFLGCSVVNFNINLGWGAEATTLSISLVEDDSPHWLSTSFAINDSNLVTSNNLSKTVPPGDINSKRTFNAYNNSTRDPDRIGSDTAPNTIVSNVSTTNTYESINNAMIGQDLHRNISLKEEIKKNTNIAENLLLSQATPPRPDFGKVYYDIKNDGTYIKQYWTGKDPGFVGESYDILGVTVRFIFHDFEFTGVVTSWKNNGGSGGKNLYTVEIKSLSTLLKNTQLIISYYPGTIFSLTKTKPSPFGLLSKFGLPSNHIGDRLNVADSEEAKNSNYQEYNFVGSVAEGNIPNIFNIYGYLETVKGWGKHDINEQGTIVRDILLGMDDLINKSDAESLGSEEDETPQDVVKLIDARFSPYGRIIGKAPAKIKQNQYKPPILNSAGRRINTINFLKDQYVIVNPQNEEFKALKEIDIAEAELQSGSVTVSQQVLVSPDYANNVAGNINLTLNKMGLVPTSISSDGIIRQHYTLDFSSLPLVPSDFRISGPVVSVMDLINHICEANNHDYFIDFIPTGNPVGRNTIKVRTISRQQQPPNNYVGQLIKDSENQNILTSYDYGLEFNDEATLRSMYVGAKQKRLLQLSSNYLSRINNSLLFDPKSAKRLTHNAENIQNALRAPDHLLTRSRNSYYGSLNQVDPTLGSGTGSIVYNGPMAYSNGNNGFEESAWNWGTNVGRANYHTPIIYKNNSANDNFKNTDQDLFKDKALPIFYVNDETGPFEINNSETETMPNYPLWDDFICPYFGLDIDGNARKVFFDSKMQQLQILCSVADIQNILGFALTTALNIQYNTTQQKDSENNVVPDPEPPKESSVSNLTDDQMSQVSSNDNAIDKGNQKVAALNTESIETFHTKWNVTNREFSAGREKFLLLENEIRAAMAGFDSWVYYTFNKNFTTDLGVLLRYTLMSTTGLIVAENDKEPAVAQINKGEPVVNMIYHGPDPHLVGDNVAESPNSSASMMNDRVSDMLNKVHSYVKNIGDTYYGKQFMVKIPGLSVSRDKPLTSNKEFDIEYETLKEPINEYKGQGRLYSNYKPATDGAWEEIGNIIDDTIIIGSITGDFFINDDGRFGPLLGYNASYEYLNDTIPDKTLEKPTKPGDGTAPTSSVGFTTQNTETTNYKSNPNIVNDGLSPGFNTVKQLGEAQQNALGIGSKGDVPNNNPPTLSMILALSSQPATGIDIIPNEWYPSLVTNLNNSDYLYYPYNFIGAPNIKELSSFTFANNNILKKSAYGSGVPPNNEESFQGPGGDLRSHLKYKLYAKGSIEENFVFIKPYSESSYREARAIITISAPIECNPVHLASKYVHHCLMVDSTIYKVVKGATVPPDVAQTKEITWIKNPETKSVTTGTLIGGLFPFEGGFGAASKIITNATDHFLDALNAVNKDANKAVTMPIYPKAAMPGFAAVPLESQAAVYGPWINYPWLVRKEIFTNPDIRENNVYLKNSIENLVGGLKVNIVEELAPWKFGGMKNLDMEAIARVENDSNYQIQQEVGTVNIPGAPIYRIGDFVDRISSLNSGPIINSIRTNISDGGISTEYSLRTFTRRFGLFNKENAQRAAQISSERLSRRKAIALQSAEISNRIASSSKTKTLNDAPKRDYTNPPIAESWRSSSELLVGHNEFSIRIPPGFATSNDLKNGVDNINNLINYDASWPFNPVWRSGQPQGSGYDVINYPKIFSNTQIMDNREVLNTLQTSYENTSFMSLDGLLSPISFYPTENARTYHITKYPRNVCRYCFGQGKIKYSDGIEGLKNSLEPLSIEVLSSQNTQNYQSKTIDCPFCEPESNKAEILLTTSKRGRVSPPFIITNEEDSIKASSEKNGTKVYKSVGTVINYSTLNPAILSYGEFSAFQNRQSGDYTSNSIRMLGIGTIPPSKESDSLNQMYSSDNRLYKSNLEYDQLYLDKVQEIHNTQRPSENIKKLQSKLSKSPRPFANNARFFGLRGPIMVHGWGYDTEGYPVPNASGELQYDSTKNPIKVKLDKDNSIETYVYKNQKFIKLEEDDEGTLRDSNGLSISDLESAGVQIVINPDGDKGYYSAPYKEPTFARGWAQVPSTWPVGPVDLRWDESAKVWTVPSVYKNVYVLLEEDLNNKNIARGELIDNSLNLDNNILALGYRKTVFVKDNMGIYAAPRSSIIYCAYDQEGGFYEPISQNSFVTSGTIVSSNSANIYKLFFKKIPSLSNNTVNSSNEPNYYVGKFSNPLNINVNVGDTALFLYTRDGWIVQANGGG